MIIYTLKNYFNIINIIIFIQVKKYTIWYLILSKYEFSVDSNKLIKGFNNKFKSYQKIILKLILTILLKIFV